MPRKVKEGDILVTINFSESDGAIYKHLKDLPERAVRGWEVKKMIITQFEEDKKLTEE